MGETLLEQQVHLAGLLERVDLQGECLGIPHQEEQSLSQVLALHPGASSRSALKTELALQRVVSVGVGQEHP